MTIKSSMKKKKVLSGVRCQFNPKEIEVIKLGLAKIPNKEVNNLNTGVGEAMDSILAKLSK